MGGSAIESSSLGYSGYRSPSDGALATVLRACAELPRRAHGAPENGTSRALDIDAGACCRREPSRGVSSLPWSEASWSATLTGSRSRIN